MLSMILVWLVVSVVLGILAGKCMFVMGAGQEAPRHIARDDGQIRNTVRSVG